MRDFKVGRVGVAEDVLICKSSSYQYYCTLTKEGPLQNIGPPPTYWLLLGITMLEKG